ncbi:MAG: asparagine synthetase B, partial [Thermodesulfobacteriota bacterium]|nr:asparagine synthetase B [Thermodesulfobacteriota bacterium]
MCGIAGIAYNYGRPVERNILEDMTNTLQHRGPDDSGILLTQNSNIHIGFGHRRLSIIDLSENGHQPMSNEDASIWITFNGEIYNYKELKKDLIKAGHLFASNSDTEVIIHGYEQYNE